MLHKIRAHLTYANLILVVALLLAASWTWGTIEALQQNFMLERQIAQLEREVEFEDIEVQLLEHERRYYESDEYLELAAREHFGKAAPGEKMLILPENTMSDDIESSPDTAPNKEPSNFQQWMSFFFGNA